MRSRAFSCKPALPCAVKASAGPLAADQLLTTQVRSTRCLEAPPPAQSGAPCAVALRMQVQKAEICHVDGIVQSSSLPWVLASQRPVHHARRPSTDGGADVLRQWQAEKQEQRPMWCHEASPWSLLCHGRQQACTRDDARAQRTFQLEQPSFLVRTPGADACEANMHVRAPNQLDLLTLLVGPQLESACRMMTSPTDMLYRSVLSLMVSFANETTVSGTMTPLAASWVTAVVGTLHDLRTLESLNSAGRAESS